MIPEQFGLTFNGERIVIDKADLTAAHFVMMRAELGFDPVDLTDRLAELGERDIPLDLAAAVLYLARLVAGARVAYADLAPFVTYESLTPVEVPSDG